MLRFVLAFLFLSSAVASACSIAPDQNISAAMDGLVASDAAVAAQSIATLRSAGPAALQALFDRYDAAPDPKLIPAIDAVAGQRGAMVSRLFWYTDLEQAKAAAKTENKPILYLRMMGKLTDEYSCANSRFFRTVLYSNVEVSRFLREQFVLVWISERPVPVVTIDYGDGRVMKRTLTGNSIHYVLDCDGRVIDALPGLYAPRTFLSAISSARSMALAKANDALLARYLERVDDSLLRNWQTDLADANLPAVTLNMAQQARQPAAAPPPAALAMRLAVSKRVVEEPLLRMMAPQFSVAVDRSIETADDNTWEKVAARHLDEARLDASSIAVIRSQNPKACEDPADLTRMVEHFQHLIALDTVHNNYDLRRRVIAWLRQSPGKLSVEDLNQRVYSELFLTPRSDPWLGLAPADSYSALCDDGCVDKR